MQENCAASAEFGEMGPSRFTLLSESADCKFGRRDRLQSPAAIAVTASTSATVTTTTTTTTTTTNNSNNNNNNNNSTSSSNPLLLWTKLLLSVFLLTVFLNIPPVVVCQPSEQIKNVIGGAYGDNVTLYFRNSPYRVNQDLTVETGATMTIETGVKMYFDPGIGLKIKGTLYAVGNLFARIQFLPHQSMLNYDGAFPKFRLIDGPTVRQGRLQAFFRDRWRSVCTQQTNWTTVDLTTACRSMGYDNGGFWRWYRRNNDTYPFVLPKPRCAPASGSLWDCPSLSDENRIPLSENLCQGEDDMGLKCWGPPSFDGWRRHWKGIQFLNVPFTYVDSDPDNVAVHKQSLSRLEYVDIHFAGYDATTKNSTAAILSHGVPPFLNGLDIRRSAGDAILLIDASGPVLIANSTIVENRGHGIAIENTTDGRVYINETRIDTNFGDGVWYRAKTGSHLQVIQNFPSSYAVNAVNRGRRQVSYYEEEKARLNMCRAHQVPTNFFFPHLIRAFLSNGTLLDLEQQFPCWMTVSLPPRLAYTFTLQFVTVTNLNPEGLGTKTYLLVCDPKTEAGEVGCAVERYRIPILNGVTPQSVSVRSGGRPLFIGLDHNLPTEHASDGRVWGDVDVQFRIHASVLDEAYYGLNITNSLVVNNTGNGVYAQDIRDRTVMTNVTVAHNQGHAGLLIRNGAGDIWLNDTHFLQNFGDGINVSFVGGSVNVNGSTMVGNRMRGAAFHQNTSYPFLNLHQEIIFKGRPSNNINYLRTVVSGNWWGGILVGNFCTDATVVLVDEPKVIINYVELLGNVYHPAFEYQSCQRGDRQPITSVDFTGSRCERGSGFCFRTEPAVNVRMLVSSNQFLSNNNTALLIRNRGHPQLSHLPAEVTISKNNFKFNRGPYIVSIGLNEDAPNQRMHFNQQNEIRENAVVNPYPYLKARSYPYAALVVSSSNVVLTRNCFNNRDAEYEIATDLQEHAKWINATQNNWGYPEPDQFMPRIFDQFNRYSLAVIDVNPYSPVCNQQTVWSSPIIRYFRQFQSSDQPYVLGGAIYENTDLREGRYTVTEDLHVLPGAKLSLAPGVILQFENSVGMLVQGELVRTYFSSDNSPVVFTKKPSKIPTVSNIRLVDEFGDMNTLEGRLEVLVDGEWGTVCNRSWHVDLALKACNQLGLAMDPEYLENWHTYPADKGELPMLLDNIRCEEMEYDLTRCRHDSKIMNINASCPASDVVGLRCVAPRWAGVRYSLLANPPTVTGQTSMNNWIIEQAGLFDFRLPQFSSALQIDWNYHSFHQITIKDSFWSGLDVVYNDLTKKPAISGSRFERNRRHGIRLRSVGISIRDVKIMDNQYAGVRYNPVVSESLQRDIVSWLERREQQPAQANGIFTIPSRELSRMELFESQLNHRKFLVAKATDDCPLVPSSACVYELTISARTNEFGMAARVAVQIVNRPGNESDEDAVFIDRAGGKQFSTRKNLIDFPVLSTDGELKFRYTRSYGTPKLVILLLFMDSREYIDKFVHIHDSEISNNQYGVSTLHYSNFTNWQDGSVLNRFSTEKLWFQKVNFTRNEQAVVWVNGPLQDALPDSPIAQIEYHIDNCSITVNNGSIIETHRDLYSSANVFKWVMWSNTIAGNQLSGVNIALPDTHDLLAKQTHVVSVTENRFENNDNFEFQLNGYYAFVNISSNNFTINRAKTGEGLILIRGMEKRLFMERNRFELNKGRWVVKYDIRSQTIQNHSELIPAYVQYNYFMRNYFLNDTDNTVDTWPRSYALGVFGCQNVEAHFNRFKNLLLDFELVSGVTGSNISNVMNVSHNWWGSGNEAEILQRVFDFDDWNTYTLAHYNPFYVSEEQFMDWWWTPNRGQLATITFLEPSKFDLRGRMYESMTLELIQEKWHNFPFYFKPERPYRIMKDLTIMPGATLTIEKGVEVHIWPNVRILVLGHLVAKGTFWQPIRFKPINVTEYGEITNVENTFFRRKRQADGPTSASVYKQFPLLKRQDPFYQKFSIYLVGAASEPMPPGTGFLEIYNATTGEMVPICDRQFTQRNAMVVCRELGFSWTNTYTWVAPRWDYNPLVRILRSYSEPRQCAGNEPKLSDCDLRLTGELDQWQCKDSEHFVFVHCGDPKSVNDDYVGNWGGITFSAPSFESSGRLQGESVLQNVEIVGAGYVHNDTTASSALEMIYRAPVLDQVNVTNSSMNAIQILAPRSQVILSQVNVTDNKGLGLKVLTTNLQSSNGPSDAPFGDLEIPYRIFGMVDMCGAGKEIRFESRLLLYYKYDSFAVDCVKVFVAENDARKVGFRILQANFYTPHDNAGRADGLRFYNGHIFTENNALGRLWRNEPESAVIVQSQRNILGIHLRGTAASGNYGFIAEIAALPSAPDAEPVREVLVRQSRFLRNDRGAIRYRSAGEGSPELSIEQCYFGHNGYHLWGNFSTSDAAVRLDLHNTLEMRFQSNMLWHNQGGLLISARSTTTATRLSGLIKDSVFSSNEKFATLALQGLNFHKIFLINNVFTKNRARYYDTVFVNRMIANFTHNYFHNNTGLHTVDLTGYPQMRTESQTFLKNYLADNTALGHGFQYPERYGYLPEHEPITKRRKRQVFDYNPFAVNEQQADRRLGDNPGEVTFDWWAHIGGDTGRYRSTVLAGSTQQHYSQNYFYNPRNDFELTTVNRSVYDVTIGAIDARENYWGYPGTPGVAAGKIRDYGDYDYLVKVDYTPVLESNTSLIEGDCPAGWFQLGVEEFKSCYLFVGAAMPFPDAVKFCEEQDAFIPYFHENDVRQEQLASRLDKLTRDMITDMERYSKKYQPNSDLRAWVSGVDVSSVQCGFLHSVSGGIGYENCQRLLPFVCEKGTKPYQEPFLWRGAGIAAVISLIILLLLILLCCALWFCKSRNRKKEHFERKKILRSSLRASKLERERLESKRREMMVMQSADGKTRVVQQQKRPSSPDLIQEAHRNLVMGGRPPTLDTSSVTSKCDSSCSADTTETHTSNTYSSRRSPHYTATNSESVYRSDYSPTESYFSGSRAPSHYAEIPALNSFQSPGKRRPVPANIPDLVPLQFRNEPGRNKSAGGRRRDTELSQLSEGTQQSSAGTYCSTCPTSTSVDSEENSRDSTITEEGSSFAEDDDRSTVTEDTVMEESSGIREKVVSALRGPVPYLAGHANARSESGFSENSRDYQQSSVTPTRDHEFNNKPARHELLGQTLHTPPRPGRVTGSTGSPGRPARAPPPPPSFTLESSKMSDSSRSQDSLITSTSFFSGDGQNPKNGYDPAAVGQNPKNGYDPLVGHYTKRPTVVPVVGPPPVPAKSLVDLHAPANYRTPVRRTNSNAWPAPLETSM